MLKTRFLIALSACGVLLAGCGGNSLSPSAGGPPPAQPSAVVTTGTGSPPAAALSAAEVCRYLTVDEVKHALQYTGGLQSVAGPTVSNEAECDYRVPGDDVNAATLSISPGTEMYDTLKAIGNEPGCVSAGVGDRSYYCPQALLSQVTFVESGRTIVVGCGSELNLKKEAGDPMQAALALAKFVANEL
jgi:hypothetical protein